MKQVSSPVNLDERVVFTLIISGIVSVGIMFLSFRYYNNNSCSSAKINFKPGKLYTGQPIQFDIGSKENVHETAWYFEGRVEKGTPVFHSFTTAGLHKIRLTINDFCIQDTVIYVSEPVPDPSLIPQFSGPQTAFAGQPVFFKDSTPNATQWEWQFGETGSVDATIKNPSYTFKSPGLKTVALVVNGKMHGKMQVYVNNKPVRDPLSQRPDPYRLRRPLIITRRQPQTAPLDSQSNNPPGPNLNSANIPLSKNPPISEEELKQLLINVINGKSNVTDFTDYLSDLNINVNYNRSIISFPELCSRLRRDIGKSTRVKYIAVSRTINLSDNKIQSMTVVVKLKFLPKILH